MANGTNGNGKALEVLKNFTPLTEQDEKKLLSSIRTRENKLMIDVRHAIMNAVYYSYMGRAEPAQRLVQAVPNYLIQQVKDQLSQYGKLKIEGRNKDNIKIGYEPKSEVIVGEKHIAIPNQEQKDQVVEVVRQLPIEVARRPSTRRGRSSAQGQQNGEAGQVQTFTTDYHAELKKALNKLVKRHDDMGAQQKAGNSVEELHIQLLERMLGTLQEYEREEMGIFAPDAEEETEEERRIKELEAEIAKLKGQDTEGRAPIQNAA
jgi:hypothetical protein